MHACTGAHFQQFNALVFYDSVHNSDALDVAQLLNSEIQHAERNVSAEEKVSPDCRRHVLTIIVIQ